MQITSIGIDLGKTTFHLVALEERGKVVIKQKFSRKQLFAYTANLPSSLIGIEACSGAHFMGAALRDQGHDVRLIPAQFVKPFLKSNKNDFLDAEAIAEAVARENMRFVPIKTDDQLDLQALHRVRDRLVHRRTALINQIRGFLLERGITFAKGPAKLRQQMPAILENADENLTPRLRSLLDHLWQEWKGLNSDIERVSDEIDAIADQDAACRRLRQIPGVGPLVATATVAAIGNDPLDAPGDRVMRASERAMSMRELPADALRADLERLLGDHEGEDSLCRHGETYGTVCSTVVGLAGSEVATYRFAAGPPCVTAFAHVAVPLHRPHGER